MIFYGIAFHGRAYLARACVTELVKVVSVLESVR